MLLRNKNHNHSPIRTATGASTPSAAARARNWLMGDLRRPAIVGGIAFAIIWGGITMSLTNAMNDDPAPAEAAVGVTPSPGATGQPGASPEPTAIPSMALPPKGTDYPAEPFGIKASPTTAPSATGDDGPASGDDAAAVNAARQFATAWLSASTAKDQKSWMQSLSPVTSPRLLALLQMTDRRLVPRTTVKEVRASADMGIMAARVTLANATTMRVTYSRSSTNGQWLVDGFEPA